MFDPRKYLPKGGKIKLPGGVVGKVSWVLMVACGAIASIAVSSKNDWIVAGSLAAIFILVFTLLWRLISFANKNPQAAILEGAEFLVHQQIVMASKNDPFIPVTVTDVTSSKPIDEMKVDRMSVTQPDQITRSIADENRQTNG